MVRNGPQGHYKYMFLLIAFVIYAYCYCYFVVSHLKKNMNIAYAFSDFYQHVKSGQTVPKCIDIKYFYI